jgi:hypothetical protein
VLVSVAKPGHKDNVIAEDSGSIGENLLLTSSVPVK